MESTMCHDDGADHPAASSPNSYFTPFYGLLQEKRCLTFFSFFFFCLAAPCMQLHSSVFAGASRQLHRCLHGRALFPDPPYPTRPLRVLQLPFWAVSSSPLPHRPPQIPIGDGSALEFIPHHPAEL